MPKMQLVQKQDMDRLEETVVKLKTIKITISDCDFEGIVKSIQDNCKSIVSLAGATMGNLGAEMCDIHRASMTIIDACGTFLRAPNSLEQFKTIIRAYDSLRELIQSDFLDRSDNSFMEAGKALWG